MHGVGSRRHRDGAEPYARWKARVNASLRGVAGLDRDLEDVDIDGREPEGGALQQDPSPEPARRFPCDGAHHAVEMEARHVDLGRQVLTVQLVVVEVRGKASTKPTNVSR